MIAQPSRRGVLRLAALAAALPAVPQTAYGQNYPSRPVRLVVGFSPGGAADISARLIGQWLSERLGQQFVIENRPGAGSNIGTETVVRAPADGYTLLLVSAANAINVTLYDKLNFNFVRDIVPIAGIMRGPLVMALNPAVPARTVPEFIAHAKANPGRISMASAGVGSSPHVAGELFKMMAGIDVIHVPYRGGAPALTDLLAGQVQVMFATLPSSVAHIRDGKLYPLAVTTTTRSDALPGTPSVSDFLPGYEASDWYGMGAPKGTSADLVARLNREINAALGDSRFKDRLADLGATALTGSPTDFANLIRVDTEKWANVVKFAGAKADEAHVAR